MEFVEFFTGGGGAHIGLRAAGLTPRLAVEWNADCRETIRLNDPHVTIDDADMFEFTVGDVMKRNGIGPDFAGLIWLSPPCQGISEAGKKQGKEDPRNNLLYTVSAACRYAPNAWVVMEQVPGLLMGKAKPLFRKLKRKIRKAKRKYTAWKLTATDFGLAQKRKRLFLVCPPVGQPVPPKPQGNWAGLPPKMLMEVIHPKCGFEDPDPKIIPLLPNEKVLMQGIPPGRNWTTAFRAREYMLGYWMRRKAKGKDLGDVMPKYPGHLRRLSWHEPAPTVIASWPQAFNFRVHPCHPQEDRYLTNGECRELQGFPRSYLIYGSEQTEINSKGQKKKITPAMSRRRQIGNAVPPPFAEKIGRPILASAT